MKKILLISSLITLVAVLSVPAVALAQPLSPPECCKIGQNFNWTSGQINGINCTPAAPCSLVAGDFVGPTSGVTCQTGVVNKWGGQWGLICVMNAVYTVTNWIFIVLIAIVAIMVIWGGLTIVTAGGAPEKVSTGRSYIVYAAVGFALALLSKAIPALVRSVLGVA